MKLIRLLTVALTVVSTVFFACQKEAGNSATLTDQTVSGNKPVAQVGACISNAYVVTLESKTAASGNWTWIWSVQNPNPGNGTNGTFQDMSHWGMQFGQCLNWADVVGAAYSADGITWTTFTPVYQPDPSQSCVSTAVLKYALGTTGSAKSYYKLILNKNYSVNPQAPAYYKSGARMPCCTFTFNGVGCPIVDEWCAYSQGYWFARPETVWCQDVVFGANSYTQTQGGNIWTNAPANSVAKKAFTQAAALQLSRYCTNGGNAIPADILAAYTTCANFLSGLSYNDILTGAYPASGYPAVAAAAGAIGSWITENHCD